MKRLALILAGALALAGCGTFNEAAFPKVEVVRPSVKTSVAIVGFNALLTEYITVGGYSTVYVPGTYGRYHYHPGYFETVPVQTTVAQTRQTDVFQRRAKDALEVAGFTIAAPTPDWTVEVDFGTPFASDGDATREAAWVILSVFFCDYSALNCTAKLKIRDNRTGELVFTRSYEQKYETNSFGLIPIFGILSCEKTKIPYMEGWCYGALTDRIVADAAAFLAEKTKAK